MKGIYYIQNTINEWGTHIMGYFPDLESTKEAMKSCGDWWRPDGTGEIYYIDFGLKADPELVYEVK